jgi:hypothetical protein
MQSGCASLASWSALVLLHYCTVEASSVICTLKVAAASPSETPASQRNVSCCSCSWPVLYRDSLLDPGSRRRRGEVLQEWRDVVRPNQRLVSGEAPWDVQRRAHIKDSGVVGREPEVDSTRRDLGWNPSLHCIGGPSSKPVQGCSVTICSRKLCLFAGPCVGWGSLRSPTFSFVAFPVVRTEMHTQF